MAPSWDELVAALRAYGVRYLSGGYTELDASAAGTGPAEQARANGAQVHSATGMLPDPGWLIASLARSDEPRLRHAVAALLLLHPELQDVVQRVVDDTALENRERDRLVEAYIAAVYLQRMWRTRLRRHLGEQPELRPRWIDEWGLPLPGVEYGVWGLAALNRRMASSTGRRVRARSAADGPYAEVARHVLAQLVLQPGVDRAA